MSFVNHFIRVV